jgi:hypothetical protein
VIVTDVLRSSAVARRETLPGVEYRKSRYLNGRAEVSRQFTRQRERQMQRFKSAHHAQRFFFLQRACCEIAGIWVMDGWEKCGMRREAALCSSLHPFRGSFSGLFRAADRVPG